MPNQNECDHMIGAHSRHTSRYCSPVFKSVPNAVISDPLALKFSYCPMCGAKIDWVKIEEMGKSATD